MMGKLPCCDKSGLKKGPWTAEEDQKLIDYIQKHGHGRWRTLPKNAGLKRCGKSCRLRWTNYLRPDVKRGKFSDEEEEAIIQFHSVLGNKWSAIAARLPGRTDNEIKNYWNTHIKKKLLRMGIDPVTHKPCLDLLHLYSVLSSSLDNSPHHQSNVSGLIGVGSILSPNLLNLATSLVSCPGINQAMTSKPFQEHQPGNNQATEHIQSAQQDLLQNQIQACTNSDSTFLNETQFVQPNLEQIYNNPANFISCQSTSWQASMGEGLVPNNCGYIEGTNNNEAIFNPGSFENQQNFMSFSTLLSTPSSSTTPLHSSSTTYVNVGNEDERDSYCSNMLMFDIPNCLNNANVLF